MIIDAHAHCDVRFGLKHTPDVLIDREDENPGSKPARDPGS